MSGTQEVRVPDLGDFADVEIVEVLVAPGDTVAVEDPLITLETDKAAMDVPAPVAGTVAELAVVTGGRVSQGDLILTLTVEAAVTAPAEGAATESPVSAESGPKADVEAGLWCSVRALAATLLRSGPPISAWMWFS